jgi:polar amino acid transport system permease protein
MFSFLSYLPKLLQGLLITLELTFASLIFGGLLALCLVALRSLRIGVLSALVISFSAFMRGTPLLAQLFLIYYGSAQLQPWLKEMGLWFAFSNPIVCAIFAFSLNTAAYQAEIFRGAINSIPRGQIEAARAMAMPKLLILWRIIVPLGGRQALRPYSNEVILMLKGSAVASVVAVYDMLGSARAIFASTYDYSVYVVVGVCYVLAVEGFRRLLKLIERKVFYQGA